MSRWVVGWVKSLKCCFGGGKGCGGSHICDGDGEVIRVSSFEMWVGLISRGFFSRAGIEFGYSLESRLVDDAGEGWA